MNRLYSFDVADDAIDCSFTLNLCSRLTVDALCCVPCCCFCGGCCGKYQPCAAGAFPESETKDIKQGSETFMITCYTQLMSGILMPWTFCGCCWACCGLGTPCVKSVYRKVRSNDPVQKNVSVTPPPQQDMQQDIPNNQS